jgi:hypothetical protein
MAIAVVALLALLLAPPAQAQTFSAADLEGTWEVFQLATPRGTLTGADVRTYRGQVTFDATGVVTGASPVGDNIGGAYLASGNFSVSAGGVVGGSLILTSTDPGGVSGVLTVREARLLANRHTIVGAATVFDQVGLFTLAKREDGQTFGLADIGGVDSADWNYHELTPSNVGSTAFANGAAWVNGSITFHGSNGCSEADLVLADGTIRAQRTDGVFAFG